MHQPLAQQLPAAVVAPVEHEGKSAESHDKRARVDVSRALCALLPASAAAGLPHRVKGCSVQNAANPAYNPAMSNH